MCRFDSNASITSCNVVVNVAANCRVIKVASNELESLCLPKVSCELVIVTGLIIKL